MFEFSRQKLTFESIKINEVIELKVFGCQTSSRKNSKTQIILLVFMDKN